MIADDVKIPLVASARGLLIIWAVVAVLSGACSGSRSIATKQPLEAWTTPVHGPKAITTPAGARLQVPVGFSAQRRNNVIALRVPERTVKVFVVEVAEKACAPAVKKAWSLADPAFQPRVERSFKPPATSGFDETYVEAYVEQPDGQHAQAIARRKGERVWVALVRGTAANLDKRAAQIRSFIGSMKAPGVEEVDLSKKKPRSVVPARDTLLAFIREAMKATGTPGLSIAVVEEGKVVLAEGFGVRELGRSEPITPDTLMMIGSVSKSLSTLMMAILVDQGKLRWNAPVTQVYPRFRLAGAKVTAAVTVEQLVCACAGLPRKDLPLLLEFAHKQPEDVFRELSTMAPSTGLRETFQYQNHMVAAGGYVAAHAFAPKIDCGEAYDRAMAELVFGPLGMTSTTLDHDAAIQRPNRATPHAKDLTGVHRIVSLDHERFATFIRPSGGIWSTARDMARYVTTELSRGVPPSGERVVSEANLTYRRKPQVKISADVSYGLGWVVAKARGLRMIIHTGGTMGFATRVGFLPDHGRGVVMISNGSGGHLVETVVFKRLVELWFQSDKREADDLLRFALREQKKRRIELEKRTRTPAAQWIKPFVGKHHNDEIGPIVIAASGDGYVLDAGEYKTRLLSYDRPDGKKVLLFADPPLSGLQLIPVDGGQGTLKMRRAQETYVFKRVQAKR